jgi:very-short-patch-repair endonuclease
MTSFLPYNKELLNYSQSLRENMTDAERRLWLKLRLKQLGGHQFYGQKIIGKYIVDFFCPKAKLIIEVDGSQHMYGKVAAVDRIRDAFMAQLGYRVLRVNDNDVLNNIEGVVEVISEMIVVKGKNPS